jgi:hypothetical protein
MSFRFAWIPLLWLALATPFVEAGDVALVPSRDNTLFEQTNASSQTSNALGDIFVGRTNQASLSIRRGLVQFDVASAVPFGATITGATLELREATGANGDQPVSLHRLLQNWGEGTSLAGGGAGAAATPGDATWLYAFYATALADRTPWATPGGVFDPVASATTTIVDDFAAPHVFSWSSAGMVADVQQWLDNPSMNFGWAILGNESAQRTTKVFNAGEATSPAVSPVLRVTFVPEPATVVLLGFVALSVLAFRVPRRQRAVSGV